MGGDLKAKGNAGYNSLQELFYKSIRESDYDLFLATVQNDRVNVNLKDANDMHPAILAFNTFRALHNKNPENSKNLAAKNILNAIIHNVGVNLENVVDPKTKYNMLHKLFSKDSLFYFIISDARGGIDTGKVIETIKYLITKGEDINAQNSVGDTVLHKWFTLFRTTWDNESPEIKLLQSEITRFLFGHIKDYKIKNDYEHSPLIAGIKSCSITPIQFKAALESINKISTTVLFEELKAIEAEVSTNIPGIVEIAKKLQEVAKECLPDYIPGMLDDVKFDPHEMFKAVDVIYENVKDKNAIKLFFELIENEDRADALNVNGQNILNYILSSYLYEPLTKGLHDCLPKYADLDIIQYLVIHKHASVTSVHNLTKLQVYHHVVMDSAIGAEAVKFLKDHGADINALDIRGCTPICLGFANKKLNPKENKAKIIAILENGGDPEIANNSEKNAINYARGDISLQLKIENWKILEAYGYDARPANWEGADTKAENIMRFNPDPQAVFKFGIDVDYQTPEGKDLQTLAEEYGRVDVTLAIALEKYSKNNDPSLLEALCQDPLIDVLSIACNSGFSEADKDCVYDMIEKIKVDESKEILGATSLSDTTEGISVI